MSTPIPLEVIDALGADQIVIGTATFLEERFQDAVDESLQALPEADREGSRPYIAAAVIHGAIAAAVVDAMTDAGYAFVKVTTG